MSTFKSQYNDSMQVYRRALGKKVEKGVWQYGKLAQFTGFIDVAKYRKSGFYGGTMSLKPSGKVIDIRKDFETEGSLQMDIPILYPLTGQGVIGGQELHGNEEQRKILTKKVSLNQIRNAVKIQDNKMSKQALKKPEIQMALMEKGAADLQDWFTRKISFLAYQAALAGYSDNLTDSTNGVGLTIKSHPNLYIKGVGLTGGKVAFTVAEGGTNSFTTAYENSVSSSLKQLYVSGNVAATAFTAQDVRNIVFLGTKHKVQPSEVVDGTFAPILLLHSTQIRQLRSDPEWQQAQRVANVRGEENPVFSGLMEGYLFEGAFIISDDTIPGAYVTSSQNSNGVTYAGTAANPVQYGRPDYMLVPRDVSPLKPAILLGVQSITGGYASPIAFEREEWDYSQFIGDAADAILGLERADITDDDGYFGTRGAFYENASSLVYFTYSPDGISI